MKKTIWILLLMAAGYRAPAQIAASGTRQPVDPVGFATTARQMDSVVARINRQYGEEIRAALDAADIKPYSRWKTVICPHDDYAYASWQYPAILQNVKAPLVILIGVAHKARQFGLEDRMVFGSFSTWKEPYGKVPVSLYQGSITNRLPAGTWVVHDSLMAAEHSLEAIVPWLQYYNRDISIVPVLVPYMSFPTMKGLSLSLARAIFEVMQENGLSWGKDYAIVISTDAVHYGDEDWGGQNYARYGADSAGYEQAVKFEKNLIATTLTGSPAKAKIEAFYDSTVSEKNYKDYKWTWCGRYSVPFGLLVTETLSGSTHTNIKGLYINYKTSITGDPVRVSDLGMGTTAPANLRHWVGYASIGYK